jgi:hypothetical protein
MNQAARAGEMCVNAGGDQGRDDYGLPPVDIEIPDDARELARDVQAYHRELRSRRRRHLARRLYGPLTRDGMVLPLLAGCLALTLVAATLLTVFTARQPTGLRPQRPATGTGSRAPARPGAALVHAILFKAGQATPLDTLPGPVVVLALIPPGCRCLADLRKLTDAALHANTLVYLVGVHNASLDGLTRHLGLGATQALEDTHDQLPAPYNRVAALTAVVVRPDGTAQPVLVQDRGHGFQFDNDVRALATGGSPASPARLVPASASPAAASTSDRPAPAATGAPSG